ncbi:MAG: amidohydrolase family protein [Verrucomicrobia bacterium]|nr:amidohydrolase family protein [Verrucomicrobiota bacterium]
MKALYFLLLTALAAVPAGKAVTVLTGARIIDGTGRPPLENGVLVIDGAKIVDVGAPDAVHPPAGAQVVDVQGKTLIPGLISAHSHLGLCQGALGPNPAHYTRENVRNQLEQYERYGVLTVMALGGQKDVLYAWREEQRRGAFGGADIFTADRGLGVPRGAPPFPFFEDQMYRPTNAEEARAAVRDTAARHADMIKLWVDDLFGRAPKMPASIFDAITDEAHRNGLRVAAHLFYLADAKTLVRAGIDVVAHSVRDQPVDADLLAAMRARGVAYIPTLDLDESQYIYAEHPAWTQEPFFTQAVDPSLLERWNSPLYAMEMKANPDTPKNKAAALMGQRNVKTIFDAGIMVAMGTDSGALPTRIPGFAEHRELQLLVQAGLSPMDAIVCATRNSAELLHATDRGALAPGRRADFPVLNGNPLEDIRHTEDILMIYHNGKRVR